MTTATNSAGETNLRFEELFNCDAGAKNHGFTSWDNFFTRTYREGVRLIASPERDDVIANACESLPYRVARDVKARDKFWIKGQPYAIMDMLANDKFADQFIDGTIYQAFLSALSYHRWHSPVSGKIVKAYVVDGTYYSQPPFTSFEDPQGIQRGGENLGQEYLSALATQALVFIEANNPDIGLMCMIAVGMVEVSTCEITVKEGQQVKKGEQLGMFHFGGSTHCLVFRKGVNVQGFPEPGKKSNVPVRSQVAHVLKKLRD